MRPRRESQHAGQACSLFPIVDGSDAARGAVQLRRVTGTVREAHVSSRATRLLRFATWLAPSLPLELFGAIAAAAGDALGSSTTLASITDRSGPDPGCDPLTAGEVDVGFLCAPAYLELRRCGAPVELLGVSPLFDDERAAGRPLYFSDVIVSSSSRVRALAELRGGVLAFNDPSSLSGWHCFHAELPRGEDVRSFFREARCSGAHLRSLELVAAGEADVAAIDSNVLRMVIRSSPRLAARIRILHTWGPWPIQPIVVRSALDGMVKRRLREALLASRFSSSTRSALRRFGLVGFASVRDGDDGWGIVEGSGGGRARRGPSDPLLPAWEQARLRG